MPYGSMSPQTIRGTSTPMFHKPCAMHQTSFSEQILKNSQKIANSTAIAASPPGLVVRERGDSATLDDYKLPYCHSYGGPTAADLRAAVAAVKPTVLVGISNDGTPSFMFDKQVRLSSACIIRILYCARCAHIIRILYRVVLTYGTSCISTGRYHHYAGFKASLLQACEAVACVLCHPTRSTRRFSRSNQFQNLLFRRCASRWRPTAATQSSSRCPAAPRRSPLWRHTPGQR